MGNHEQEVHVTHTGNTIQTVQYIAEYNHCLDIALSPYILALVLFRIDTVMFLYMYTCLFLR